MKEPQLMLLVRRLLYSGLILSFVLLIINWPFSSDRDSTEIGERAINGRSAAPSDDPGSATDQSSVIKMNKSWTGDFDGMVERGIVRMLVVYNKIIFFFDRGRQLGTAPFLATELEKLINDKLGRNTQKVRVILIPVTRDQLIPALLEGKGDVAFANLTVTPERQRHIDFSDPLITGIRETLVTGPRAPSIDSIDDLSGKALTVRKSSSYYSSLRELNKRFANEGKRPVQIEAASEYLEDSDLLEMVNAGLLEMAVVDSHKAEFWTSVFDDLTHRSDIYVREGAEIAAALRKKSPQMKALLNELVASTRKGTLLGNIAFKKYLKENQWARSAMTAKELGKAKSVLDLFKKYAEQYDLDYLKTLALAYQESQLDHSRRSPAGAVGIMQLLKSTARDPNVDIEDIEDLESNIHAGTKYLRFLRNRYFDDPAIDPLNQILLSVAAYNAGPRRIAQIRDSAEQSGFDPNIWFNNVEIIVARQIGRETVQYVSNIYKYYLAYRSVKDLYGIQQY